ncbi:hypothetical protein H4R21_004379, partial [Coemansia helicoidea]
MWATKRPASPTASGPAKRLVIRGLAAPPALPATYKADTLARLRAAVHAIQQSRPTPQGLEQLYRDCESLCLHRFAGDVYAMLQTELQAYARQQLQAIDGEADGAVLGRTQRFWEGYTQQLAMIRCVFLYLDRTYALQTPNVASLWAMGLAVVRHHLLADDLRARLVRLFVCEANRERSGEAPDCAALASISAMFVDLGLYAQHFLPSALGAARDYYQKESQRLVGSLAPLHVPGAGAPAGAVARPAPGSMDVPAYLAHVRRRLDEETQHAARYLKPDSKSTLLATVRAELVERHAEKLLASSFEAMVDDNMVADLAAMYALFLPVGKVDLLQQSWAACIRKTGLRMMQAPDLDAVLVTGLLSLKRKLDTILRDAFQANARLASALREAFEAFLNTRRSKPAQLLARHADQCLRMGNRLSVADDADDVLGRLIELFRFIQAKDLFEGYYRRDLAKRLLHSKSASIDTERLMVQKLKAECGAGYTNHIEGMLRDMDAADDLADATAQAQRELGAADIGFHANVLTMAYWPTYEPLNLVLPREAEQAQASFERAYAQKRHGRNLVWQHSLGTCMLKVAFDEGPKELQLSHVQGAVLLLFADQDELSYAQIQQSTGLEGAELQRALQSLACGKFRVLAKEPRGRDVAETDVFAFNAAFKCPQARVKISQIAAAKEAEKAEKEVEEN